MPPASGVWDFGCESAAHIKTLSTSDPGKVLLTKFIKAIWANKTVPGNQNVCYEQKEARIYQKLSTGEWVNLTRCRHSGR